MQHSHAQAVAEGFIAFFNDPWDNNKTLQYTEARHDQLRELGCLSDWLQLWLDCGDAHRYCGADFGLYMHAVALVFAERTVHPALFEELEVLPLSQARDGEIPFITSPEYALPASMSLDGFMAARSYTSVERRRIIQEFLDDPEHRRF